VGDSYLIRLSQTLKDKKMQRHTAGEWKKVRDGEKGYFHVRSEKQRICLIFNMFGKSLDAEGIAEEEANADLIAAAPALLAACEAVQLIVDDMAGSFKDDKGSYEYKRMDKAGRLLDAAIAKAKG